MSVTNLPWRRIAAVAAVLSVALFFFGTASLNPPMSATDQEVIDWWNDSGNQTMAIVSMYAFMFAGLFFLIFVTYLRVRLSGSGQDASILSTLMFAAGVMFATMLAASGASRGLIAAAVKLQDEQVPGLDTLRFIPQFSYVFISAALLAAGLMIAATTALIFRTSALPRWLGWLGVVAALLLFIGTPILQGLLIPVLLIWTLAASVAVWRDAGPA